MTHSVVDMREIGRDKPNRPDNQHAESRAGGPTERNRCRRSWLLCIAIGFAFGLTGCTGAVTVAGNVLSMVVVLVLLWSTVTMDRG